MQVVDICFSGGLAVLCQRWLISGTRQEQNYFQTITSCWRREKSCSSSPVKSSLLKPHAVMLHHIRGPGAAYLWKNMGLAVLPYKYVCNLASIHIPKSTTSSHLFGDLRFSCHCYFCSNRFPLPPCDSPEACRRVQTASLHRAKQNYKAEDNHFWFCFYFNCIPSVLKLLARSISQNFCW